VLVVLLEDQDVTLRRCADLVAPDLPRAEGIVGTDVEARARVVGPREAVRHVLDDVGQVCALAQVAIAQHVALPTRRVDRVREDPLVGRDGEHAQREVVVAGGGEVLVEQHLLTVPAAGPAAVDRVVEPLDGARVVLPLPARDGCGCVGLLDPRADLLVDRVPQRLQRREHGGGVGVLGLEVGTHGRVVAVTQPVPRVDALVVVETQRRGPPRRCRRYRSGL
jgi:hypothetical protein